MPPNHVASLACPGRWHHWCAVVRLYDATDDVRLEFETRFVDQAVFTTRELVNDSVVMTGWGTSMAYIAEAINALCVPLRVGWKIMDIHKTVAAVRTPAVPAAVPKRYATRHRTRRRVAT